MSDTKLKIQESTEQGKCQNNNNRERQNKSKPTIATRHIIFKQQKNQRYKEKNLKKEKGIL